MDNVPSRPPNKSKDANRLIKYFKGAATFTVTRRPFSPTHDRASCPVAPMIPVEVRDRRTRTSGRFFDVEQEPTSPKVSCIGQIKRKKALSRLKSTREASGSGGYNTRRRKKKNTSVFLKLLKRKLSPAIVEERDDMPAGDPVKVRQRQVHGKVPGLGQMNKFAGGRGKLDGFDWRACQKEEKEEEELEIYYSGPILIDGEEKKEVSLWKRRTVVPPQPLQLN